MISSKPARLFVSAWPQIGESISGGKSEDNSHYQQESRQGRANLHADRRLQAGSIRQN
jgi:hypothetical protein